MQTFKMTMAGIFFIFAIGAAFNLFSCGDDDDDSSTSSDPAAEDDDDAVEDDDVTDDDDASDDDVTDDDTTDDDDSGDDDDDDDDDTTDDDDSVDPTWDNFAEAFFSDYCTRCHASSLTGLDRNFAPVGVDYDTYALAVANAAGAKTRAADSTGMPLGNPKPATDERAELGQWVDNGTPEN